ncbi:MAG: right-handed parallel beta-helix repeat-containing protein [Meiothermus sp.]|nr:right-handed parallel beta-helix repeat-containing protein [Meiothermus sp.]
MASRLAVFLVLLLALASAQQPEPPPPQAPTTPSSRPPEASTAQGGLVVQKGGDLVAAIAKAPAGATLRIEAGVFTLTRGLVVDKPLTLIGAGRDQTRVRGDLADFVVSVNTSGRFSATGISFEHFGNKIANVVVVGGGQAVFERCRFSGANFNVESGQGGDGIWVRGGARVVLNSSEFLDNQLHGIDVSETAQVTATGNVVRGNRDAGIGFYDEARGLVSGNTVEANNAHGIYVSGQSRPTLERNRLLRNRLYGIYVEATASPTLRANTFSRNRRGTLQFLGQAFTPNPRPGADLTSILARAPEGSTVTLAAGEYRVGRGLLVSGTVTVRGQGRARTLITASTGDYVLRYAGRGRLRLQGLTLAYNGTGASDVAQVTRGELELSDCAVRGGRTRPQEPELGVGVFASGMGKLTVRGCQITGNALRGLEAADDAQVSLDSVRVEGNQSSGLSFYGKSLGALRSVTIAGNRLHGLELSEQTRVSAEGLSVSAQTGWGVIQFEQAQLTLRGSAIGGNAAGGLRALGGGRIVLENSQLRDNAQGVLLGDFSGDPQQPLTGSLSGNTLEANRGLGMEYRGFVEVSAQNNTLRENLLGGMRFVGSTSAEVRGNTVERNGDTGVLIVGAAQPALIENQIREHRRFGVALETYSTPELTVTPELRGNTVERNGLYGILVEAGNALLEANQVRGSAQVGVGLFGEGAVVARQNTVEGNQTHGILVDDRVRATLEDNTVQGNALCGILLRTFSESAVRGNVIQNNGAYGLELQDKAKAQLEGNQIAGNGVAAVRIARLTEAQVGENQVSGPVVRE